MYSLALLLRILQTWHQQAVSRKKILAACNRICLLETLQQQTARTVELQRRAFREQRKSL